MDIGIDASALAGGIDGWRALYPVETIEVAA